MDEFFRILGFGLCHQLPERSFFSGGFQLPVCARDTGIYFGFVLGLLVLRLLAGRTRPTELPRWPVLALIGLFVAAMGFDGVTSYAGLRETTNDIRLITGLVTGWGMAALTLPILNAQLWSESGVGRVPEGAGQVAAWLAGIPAAFALARWILPFAGVVYPFVVSVAILVTFVAVNMVLVCLIPAFERRAHRFREAWVAVVLSGVFTVAELAAAASLRSLAERLLL